MSALGLDGDEAPSAPAAKAPRGFAAMSPERRRAYARAGGISAHKAGRAHEFTADEAKAAGRLGGLAVRRRTKRDA